MSSGEEIMQSGDKVLSISKTGKRKGQEGTLVKKADEPGKWVVRWTDGVEKPYSIKKLKKIDAAEKPELGTDDASNDGVGMANNVPATSETENAEPVGMLPDALSRDDASIANMAAEVFSSPIAEPSAAAEPGPADPSATEPSAAAEPGPADPSATEPSAAAEPGPAEPSATDPSATDPDDAEANADALTSSDEISDDMSDEIGAAISAFISENTPRTPLEYSGDGEDYDPAFDAEHDVYQEGDYDEFGHDEHYTGEYDDEEGFDEEGFDDGEEDFYAGEGEEFADPDFVEGDGDAEMKSGGEFDQQVEGDGVDPGEDAFADPSLLETIDGADERPSDLDDDALYELSDDGGDPAEALAGADGAAADPTDISQKLDGTEADEAVIEVIDADKAGKAPVALDTDVSERVEDAAAAAAGSLDGGFSERADDTDKVDGKASLYPAKADLEGKSPKSPKPVGGVAVFPGVEPSGGDGAKAALDLGGDGEEVIEVVDGGGKASVYPNLTVDVSEEPSVLGSLKVVDDTADGADAAAAAAPIDEGGLEAKDEEGGDSSKPLEGESAKPLEGETAKPQLEPDRLKDETDEEYAARIALEKQDLSDGFSSDSDAEKEERRTLNPNPISRTVIPTGEAAASAAAVDDDESLSDGFSGDDDDEDEDGVPERIPMARQPSRLSHLQNVPMAELADQPEAVEEDKEISDDGFDDLGSDDGGEAPANLVIEEEPEGLPPLRIEREQPLNADSIQVEEWTEEAAAAAAADDSAAAAAADADANADAGGGAAPADATDEKKEEEDEELEEEAIPTDNSILPRATAQPVPEAEKVDEGGEAKADDDEAELSDGFGDDGPDEPEPEPKPATEVAAADGGAAPDDGAAPAGGAAPDGGGGGEESEEEVSGGFIDEDDGEPDEEMKESKKDGADDQGGPEGADGGGEGGGGPESKSDKGDDDKEDKGDDDKGDDDDDDDEDEPDYIQEFIKAQKSKFKWSENAREFYDGLVKAHISHKDLQDKLETAAKDATGEAADDFFSLASGAVKYRNYLEGLLHEGEIILRHKDDKDNPDEHPMIPFQSVTFKPYPDEKTGKAGAEIKKPLAPGRMVITDRRMIFICRNDGAENAIKKCKPKKKKIEMNHYSVDASFTHTNSFFPIDIKSIKHISFRTKITIKSKKHVQYKGSDCQFGGKGCALCCRSMFECCFCHPKTWSQNLDHNSRTEKKNMVMGMKCEFPPWGHKCKIVMDISPDVEFIRVKRTIALIQDEKGRKSLVQAHEAKLKAEAEAAAAGGKKEKKDKDKDKAE